MILMAGWFIHSTLKVAQVNLPATAAGKWFLGKLYWQMQVKNSAGNPNLWFPLVTRGKLTATAGKLREASFLRVIVELFILKHLSLDIVSKILTIIIACCRWNEWYIHWKVILTTKVEKLIDSCQSVVHKNVRFVYGLLWKCLWLTRKFTYFALARVILPADSMKNCLPDAGFLTWKLCGILDQTAGNTTCRLGYFYLLLNWKLHAFHRWNCVRL